MKIAHLADAHLGFRQYYRQTSNGINQREADVANAFRAAIADIIKAKPDAVVIAGDLFHSVRPTNPAILFAFDQLHRLRQGLPDAPIVIIAGNHDTPRSTETGTILKLFETLGIDVAHDEARRLVYPRLDLSILAVPHQVWFTSPRPVLEPAGKEQHQVLVIHGVHENLPYADRAMDQGTHVLTDGDLSQGKWSYIALGHYHVRMEVRPRAWYSGALDYVTTNPWGELKDEEIRRVPHKGWLLVDVDKGVPVFKPVPAARRVFDLDPVEASGVSAADLDSLIAQRIGGIKGGLADQIVRIVVYNIPRHIARELNHRAIREYKAQALYFHLDLRRPEGERDSGLVPTGQRSTLRQILTSYLHNRPLPGDLDRESFQRLGMDVFDDIEREAVER
ncbi:MAG: metallophosphoesterase [Gemmatimonadota bacterium]